MAQHRGNSSGPLALTLVTDEDLVLKTTKTRVLLETKGLGNVSRDEQNLSGGPLLPVLFSLGGKTYGEPTNLETHYLWRWIGVSTASLA